jgi:hypothetical protein
MATLTSKYSLAEQAKRLDPDGSAAMIAEVLDLEMGGIIQEAPLMPSNDTWTHKSVQRGSLPTGSVRKLNSGVATEVSRVTERLDAITMIESYAEHDKALVDSMPNPTMYRMGEAQAFIEGMGQTYVSQILYSNANADPDQMHGLAPRLATLDSKFVWGGGGTGADLTSMYIVTWGPNKVFMIYPKNMSPNMGVEHEDLGVVTLTDATTAAPNTSQYQGYRDHFVIRGGLSVKDPRCLGRYANIESAGASNTFDEDTLIALINKMRIVPDSIALGQGSRIYVNETLVTQMQIKLKDKTNVNYTAEQGEGLAGQPAIQFMQIPIRKIDSGLLLNTESAITT